MFHYACRQSILLAKLERDNSNETEYMKRDEILRPLTLWIQKGIYHSEIYHYGAMSTKDMRLWIFSYTNDTFL